MWVIGKLKIYDYMTLGALVSNTRLGKVRCHLRTALNISLQLCTWGLCVCNHYQLKFGTGTLGTLIVPSNVCCLIAT